MSEAGELLRAALALRPDNPLVQAQLGLLELGRGQVDAARALLTAALRSDPDLRGRTLQLGLIALQHGDPATARFYYDLVLAVRPMTPSPMPRSATCSSAPATARPASPNGGVRSRSIPTFPGSASS